MIKQGSYDGAFDFWGLGISMIEALVKKLGALGTIPIQASHQEMVDTISDKPIRHLDETSLSAQVKDIPRKLLDNDSRERHGPG